MCIRDRVKELQALCLDIRVLDENGNEVDLKDDEDEDEIVYTGNDLPDDEQIVRGSTDEILDAGFIIDEDSPEDIMNVFDDLEEDAGNGDEM